MWNQNGKSLQVNTNMTTSIGFFKSVTLQMVHALCNIFGRQFEAFHDENEVLPANGGPCNGRILCHSARW